VKEKVKIYKERLRVGHVLRSLVGMVIFPKWSEGPCITGLGPQVQALDLFPPKAHISIAQAKIALL